MNYYKTSIYLIRKILIHTPKSHFPIFFFCVQSINISLSQQLFGTPKMKVPRKIVNKNLKDYVVNYEIRKYCGIVSVRY